MNIEQFIRKNPKSAHARVFARKLGKTVKQVLGGVEEAVVEPVKKVVKKKKKTTKKPKATD